MTLERLRASLADRYRLERELGQGGMATVYLAQDLKHHRQVAIKVLKPDLAAVLGADRFVQEITTTAQLQHPHVLPLFDSGTADGFLYYVMPYIQGETLRTKLDREHQLGIEEAVRISTEVADALDYAHRHGVIHRDIKPENVLLHDGRPMVADFGIALAVSAAAGGRMTETGLSLGTPHYMSPEQATAEKEITGKSDIYSLASVLYEMLTGNPPHVGASAQQIIVKIIADEPRPVTELRKSVPPNVAAALAKALEKLPADRFDSAKAFADALTHASTVTTVPRPGFATAIGPDAQRWRQIAMAAVAVAIGAGSLAAWGWWRPRAPAAVSRFAFDLEGRDPAFFAGGTVSPDGARIAYAQTSGKLMLRDLDRLEAVPVPGGEIGLTPFFSPNGDSLAFLTAAPGDLRVVPVGGGAATALVRDSAYATGGAWSDDGWLYFVGGTAQVLLRVRATGGPPELVARPDSTRDELFFSYPQLLPGGRTALITIMRRSGAADIAAVNLGTGAVTVLTRGLRALYSRDGFLIVLGSNGVVQAVRLDPRSLRLEGRPVTFLQGVAPGSVANGVASFALSNTGTLLYETEQPPQQVVQVSREGGVQVIDPNWSGGFGNLSLSPDGRRLAVTVWREGRVEVWVRELASGTLTRLAYEGTYSYRASWTPDGRSLLFISDRSGRSAVYQALADGVGSPTLVRADPRGDDEAELSRDGRWLVYRTGSGGGRDIYAIRPGLDSAPVPIVTTPFEDHSPVLSPDGRWLAYVSDESGRPEVYVRPFPNVRTARWQVSRAGGAEPVWAHSGRELFYRSGSGDLVAAAVTLGVSFQVTAERVLFPTRDYFYDGLHPSYTVSPDDRSFLFVRFATGVKSQAVVVLNWLEELRAKMAQ